MTALSAKEIVSPAINLYDHWHLVIKSARVDSPPCPNNLHSLSKLLKQYRLQSGMAQEALASALGVNMKTLQNWERGHTKPKGLCARILSVITQMSQSFRSRLHSASTSAVLPEPTGPPITTRKGP